MKEHVSTPAEVAFGELVRSIHAALETYSNVHRGSGHYSQATTRIYERARGIVLGHLGLGNRKYVVIFCSRRRAEKLMAQTDPSRYRVISSEDIGLSLGVTALAVKKGSLPKKIRFDTGGGTAKLVSHHKIIWAKAPDLFEAGTPAIINVIAFARALQLLKQYGFKDFVSLHAQDSPAAKLRWMNALGELSGEQLLEKVRETMIGRNLPVPVARGSVPFINLDYSASTPALLPVWDSARAGMLLRGDAARELVEEVRSLCSGFLNAPSPEYDVFFTSNTTEGINLVAESLFPGDDGRPGPVILNTLLEHNSNDLPWRTIPGSVLLKLPISEEGFIDTSRLEALLQAYNRDGMHGERRIRLVAVSGASNVLGIYNDLAEISRLAHTYGAHVLVDAAQMAAHRRIDTSGWGIDYIAFSGHKVYAPFGCGVLAVRKGSAGFELRDPEQVRRSGEENLCGIAALGTALNLMQRIGFGLVREEEQRLTARLLSGISPIPGLKVYGVSDTGSEAFDRKGGVVAFEIKGWFADRVARELALRGGIGVRFGCHCAHLLIKHLFKFTPRLERIQNTIVTLFPGLQLPGMTRVSLGIGNTVNDIDGLIATLGEITRKEPLDKKAVKKQVEAFAQAAERRVYSEVKTK